MTDVLAVIRPEDGAGALLDELARRRPDRVTVLLEDDAPGWGSDDSEAGVARRDRLAALLHAIEDRTGAVVVGLAGDSDQLRGWRFDRVVRSRSGAALAA
ncbi:MAG TPA: hypothetical protein VGH93_00885 [Solirubrobacteraceae bacterium]